jgi:hypothetical protein
MSCSRGLNFTLRNRGNCCQIDGNVEQGDELDDDAKRQGALSADEVDEEEGTDDCRDELYDTENGGCEELLCLSSGPEESKELGCVDRD